jgi:hypothetical protein
MAKTYRRPVNALAYYIGKVTIAWNDVQFALLYIFQELIGNPKLARSLYFSAPSDRAQQKMVRDTIDTILKPIDAPLAKRMRHEINRINAYNDRRNDVVHALWTTDPPTKKVVPLQPNSTLKGKDLKKAMNELTEELMMHAVDLHILRQNMMNVPHFKQQALARVLLQEKP